MMQTHARAKPPGQESVTAPGALRLALELRVPFEFGASIAALPLLYSLPNGDGHPVLVFPGLAASDTSTAPLRRFLVGRGYDARSWDLGRNLGPGRGVLQACFERVRQMHAETGRKVTLIGWSLGGIYAREAAKAVSASTRAVITLGTPFAGHMGATNATRVYEMASGEKASARTSAFDLPTAPPVPTTSIYSRTDGIVAWQCSVQAAGQRTDTENIEVEASHIGLGFNPTVLYAVADRLAQAEGKWKPFDRSGLKQLFYGDPKRANWHPKSWMV
jgi:pimeloyl-ACP methyl ester carboxylesterase